MEIPTFIPVPSGTIELIAKAEGKRSSYNWQMSRHNAITRQSMHDTVKAKTTVSSLTPRCKLMFRLQAVTKEGQRGWSQNRQVL